MAVMSTMAGRIQTENSNKRNKQKHIDTCCKFKDNATICSFNVSLEASGSEFKNQNSCIFKHIF